MVLNIIDRLINLLQNLRGKINDTTYVWDLCKWLIKKAFEPRAVGAEFSQREGNFLVYYEVIAHTHDKVPKEIIREFKREPITNI